MAIDEDQIRNFLSERLERDETLLYSSIPQHTPATSFAVEVLKGIFISGGICVVIFLAVWSKYHNFDAARNIAQWGFVFWVILLVAHSIHYYRKNARTITFITNKSIHLIEYKKRFATLNAVTRSKTTELKEQRIELNNIESIRVLENSDGSGIFVYTLKTPMQKKPLHDFHVLNFRAARAALPTCLLLEEKKPGL